MIVGILVKFLVKNFKFLPTFRIEGSFEVEIIQISSVPTLLRGRINQSINLINQKSKKIKKMQKLKLYELNFFTISPLPKLKTKKLQPFLKNKKYVSNYASVYHLKQKIFKR